MKLKKWKSFLCIWTSSLLVLSSIAYADTITIAPLDESRAASFSSGGSETPSGGSGNGSGSGAVSSNGPGVSGSSGSETVGTPPGASANTGQSAPGASGNAGQSATGTSGGAGQSGPGASGNADQGTSGTSGNTNQNDPGTSIVLDEAKAAAVQKPAVSSEGAVLMEASSGKVLYAKNGDKQFYPASITKLMTALLIAENCNLGEKVTFSSMATTNLESGAVSINMTAGDVMTVEECLYALLLKSANEVGNALAEYAAGNNASFADMMNTKAAALGCTNTHFTNPHGLNDSNHYTTPHDMALIARAAFQNDVVKTVASTRTHKLPATIKNPSGLTVTIGHKMLNPSDSRYYPGIIGGKTGYTSKAGNTLVTVVEKDGVRLIAVIMKSKSTHYTDTKALFDYGYQLVTAGALTSGGSAGTAASGSQSGSSGPSSSLAKGWGQDSKGWYYNKDNGAKASGEWIALDGQYYWFDSNTYMAKGWRQIGGKWYFLRSNGMMARNQWEKVEENGQWFYLGSDGAMLVNTTTPDGHRVNDAGAWVE